MKNRVTEMFGIEFPILAFSHCRDVVAAVSKAGGMGVLGAVAHTPEDLDRDLDWIEAEIGDRPYGVDLIIPARYAGDDAGGYSLAGDPRADPGRPRRLRRGHPGPLRRAAPALGRRRGRGRRGRGAGGGGHDRRRRPILGQRGRPPA